MRKILLSLIVCIAVGIPTFSLAETFTDVPEKGQHYRAVNFLVSKGIVHGYEDGSFKLGRKVTRAEFAKMVMAEEMTELKETEVKGTFQDVSAKHWAARYIEAAAAKGYVNGVGKGRFKPNDYVTIQQVNKVLCVMAGMDKLARQKGGYPEGYNDIAYEIDLYGELYVYPEDRATRGDVAVAIYNMSNYLKSTEFRLNGEGYKLGEATADELGQPDEIIPADEGISWYVYDTRTYEDFCAIAVNKDGRTVEIINESKNYLAGLDEKQEFLGINRVLRDENDNGRIHGVRISTPWNIRDYSKGDKRLKGEEKLNFHLTNAFRVIHGKHILEWDDRASEAAYLHSKDMHDQGYFNHQSLDGSNCGERIRAQGLKGSFCGENIAMGYADAFDVHGGWVNSAGHRRNMLYDEYASMGVGSFGGYYTQNFFNDKY